MKTTLSRREFIVGLPDEALGIFRRLRGQGDFKLSELGSLSDSQLGVLIPGIVVDGLVEQDGRLWRIAGAMREEITLMSHERPALLAAFNGADTLKKIAAAVALEKGADEAPIFKQARELFLTLVDKGAVMPCNAPD